MFILHFIVIGTGRPFLIRCTNEVIIIIYCFNKGVLCTYLGSKGQTK